MKSVIKRMLPRAVKDGMKEFVLPRVYPRRIHAYCTGAMKTGTTSIAGLFKTHYRTEHEPDKYRLIEAVLAHSQGHATRDQLVRFVRKRDRRLWLEMESSGFASFITDILASEFPDARFILSVRDCRSWLDSAFNHLLARSLTPAETAFIRWALQPEKYGFSPHEKPLEDNKLFPIDCFLDFWTAHNRRTTDHVSPDRLLVLPTETISTSAAKIASFLGVPADTIDSSQSHLYKAKASFDLLSQLDSGFVDDRIAARCGELEKQLRAGPLGEDAPTSFS